MVLYSICVCVCVCVVFAHERERERECVMVKKITLINSDNVVAVANVFVQYDPHVPSICTEEFHTKWEHIKLN
jgi:hypothetical protein